MSQIRVTLLILLQVFLLAGCFGSDANLTERGLSRPELSLAFPERTEAGAIETARLRVTNPGPGDMAGLIVSFAALGDPRLPRAIVGIGSNQSNPAVVAIEPSPNAVSQDGVVYTFPGLKEGESTTLTFQLKLPERPGVVANALMVSDAQDLERARGVRLETTIER